MMEGKDTKTMMGMMEKMGPMMDEMKKMLPMMKSMMPMMKQMMPMMESMMKDMAEMKDMDFEGAFEEATKKEHGGMKGGM